MDILFSTGMLLQWLLFIYIALSAFYFLFFAVASVFPYHIRKDNLQKQHRFAVLIPGFKEDKVILEVIDESLNQNYPANKYDIIVIADSFEKATLNKIRQKPVKLIEVSFDRSTKSKALNKAFEQLPEDEYDLAVVLDADNIMEPDYLEKINQAFSENQIAIQGHRVAKNNNTAFSVLDAISEEINNNVFRKGHRNVGLSSALIGSAMAFRYGFFKEIMRDVNAIGGFDKQLELKIIKNRHIIDYHASAYVFDEKVQNSQAFSNQRKRWISAQLYYLRKDFLISFWHFLSKGNLDYFNKAFQFVQPPRILLLGLLLIINTLSLFFNPPLLQALWMTALLFSLSGFFAATPRRFYTFKTLKALSKLPFGFLLMFKSLLFHREAKTHFIHTEHTTNYHKEKDSS